MLWSIECSTFLVLSTVLGSSCRWFFCTCYCTCIIYTIVLLYPLLIYWYVHNLHGGVCVRAHSWLICLINSSVNNQHLAVPSAQPTSCKVLAQTSFKLFVSSQCILLRKHGRRLGDTHTTQEKGRTSYNTREEKDDQVCSSAFHHLRYLKPRPHSFVSFCLLLYLVSSKPFSVLWYYVDVHVIVHV